MLIRLKGLHSCRSVQRRMSCGCPVRAKAMRKSGSAEQHFCAGLWCACTFNECFNRVRISLQLRFGAAAICRKGRACWHQTDPACTYPISTVPVLCLSPRRSHSSPFGKAESEVDACLSGRHAQSRGWRWCRTPAFCSSCCRRWAHSATRASRASCTAGAPSSAQTGCISQRQV